ncbi:uncharacterized protein [Rutidosis leptorrhynchoides]|uniref:uncharacterized protein isoform X2 n=1 Tax=Rutidosis leptorrhynchoides TaxID=125765 RepID=UPI003A993F21
MGRGWSRVRYGNEGDGYRNSESDGYRNYQGDGSINYHRDGSRNYQGDGPRNYQGTGPETIWLWIRQLPRWKRRIWKLSWWVGYGNNQGGVTMNLPRHGGGYMGGGGNKGGGGSGRFNGRGGRGRMTDDRPRDDGNRQRQ